MSAEMRRWCGRTNVLLAVALTLGLAPVPAAGAGGGSWLRSWAAAPQRPNLPAQGRSTLPELNDVTIRQVVRISAGGDRLRLRISNEMSGEPLDLGTVRVALAGENGAILPGTDRVVTFGGERESRIPAFAPAVSDPVPLAVPPLARLSISIHLPRAPQVTTMHMTGRQTGWIAQGDQSGAAILRDARRTSHRYFLTGVDVARERSGRGQVVVAIGDSITDGARASMELDRRWPDALAERLQRSGMRHVAVANAGISANRMLSEGVGPNMLARLDRDVFSVPGATHLIVLAGINDIGMAYRDRDPAPPTADDIIDAYRQLIARAHDDGIAVVGATILPYRGADYYSEAGDRVRREVNEWIRSGGEFDGVVDFDAALRDPSDHSRIRDGLHGGDFLHPSDEGYRRMAEAIDLTLFRRRYGGR